MVTFEKVKMRLREYILGFYRDGDPLCSFAILAKKLGASTFTISRVVNQFVDEGVLKRGPGRGFSVANSVVPKDPRKRAIGFLLNMPRNRINRDTNRNTFQPFQEALFDIELGVFIMSGVRKNPDNEHLDILPVQEIVSYGLGGLVTLGFNDPQFLANLHDVIPNLLTLDVDAVDIGVDSVSFDNQASALEMVLRLAEMGARRIAFVGGNFPPHDRISRQRAYDPCARERYDGWRLGLKAARLEDSLELARIARTRESGWIEEGIRALLEQTSRPDAILVEEPLEGVTALRKAGVPPGEILLAGWLMKGTQDSRLQDITLAAECDFGQLGEVGAEVLIRRIENPEAPVERRLLYPKLVCSSGVKTS